MNVKLLAYTLLTSLPGHPINNGQGTPQENLIEYAARVCYRSDGKMGHSPEFIGLRVREGHEDIIEHVRLVFEVRGQILDEVVLELVNLPSVEFTRTGDEDWIFSMNARNLRDLWRDTSPLVFAEFVGFNAMVYIMVKLATPILPAVFGDIEL